MLYSTYIRCGYRLHQRASQSMLSRKLQDLLVREPLHQDTLVIYYKYPYSHKILILENKPGITIKSTIVLELVKVEQLFIN